MQVENWSIKGADGEEILGNTHFPDASPIGVVTIAHGFKGYKDYGMFPFVAHSLAKAGLIAHRFNFSHSGMTNEIETFAKPDLFEKDTWNKEVTDYRAVLESISNGTLAGSGLPIVMFGHSRGGVTSLLAAGRYADDELFNHVVGVATAAAPDCTCNLDEETRKLIHDQGYLLSPSSRTNQELKVGLNWLVEQESEPEAHDLLTLVSKIKCPLLILHGEDDPTVPVSNADNISAVHSDVRVVHITKADHVFKTPNPFPIDGQPGKELAVVVEELIIFAGKQCKSALSAQEA